MCDRPDRTQLPVMIPLKQIYVYYSTALRCFGWSLPPGSTRRHLLLPE
jgi:hypothetical protein